VPTLILQSKDDGVAPFAPAEEMHNGLKCSVMDGTSGGHGFFVRKPDEFTGTMTRVLRDMTK